MVAMNTSSKSIASLKLDKLNKEVLNSDLKDDMPSGQRAQHAQDPKRKKQDLHELHKDRQTELDKKRNERELSVMSLANKKFKNPESDQMVITAFQKEFR